MMICFRHVAIGVLASWMNLLVHADTPSALSGDDAQEFSKTFADATPDDFTGVRVINDVQYAQYGEHVLLLDMYLPSRIQGRCPCVVTVTGGGFRARGKDAFAKYAAYLATKGFAAACIAYRGTPDHGFPETVHDCKAAVRYVRSNADTYQIDPAAIGVFGQSAGGHLAGMMAVSSGVPELEGRGGNGEVSSRVQAAVSFSGVFDFVSRLRDGGHQKKNIETKKTTNGQWVGEPFSVDSERWRLASPIHYLSEDDAPLLMIATKTDQVVPFAQSVQMHEAMQDLGLASDLTIFDTGGHGVAAAQAINRDVWSKTIAFLNAHLR